MMSEEQRIRIVREALRGAGTWKRLADRLLAERPSRVSRTTDSWSASADSLWLMREEEFDSNHPEGDCAAVHPSMSHADWEDQQEEESEEEERRNVPRFTVRRSRDTNERVLLENTAIQKETTIRKLARQGIRLNRGPSSREVKE